MKNYKCEQCHDTGWYGDNGPGIKGNREYLRCECKKNQLLKKETDLYTEKLFCLALLDSGTDVASEILTKYIKLRDSEEVNSWLEEISKGGKE